MLPTFDICGIRFNTFPFVIFAALVSCVGVYMFSPNYKKFYQVSVFKLCIPMLAFAAMGARVFSAITLIASSSESFLYNLMYGGSVFYGGLLGGMAGLFLMCSIKHYEFLVYTDLFATLLPLGHALGRLGCYLNGCCYGSQNNGILSVDYVVNGIHTTVFPTWFIEAGFCIIIFFYFQFFHKINATGNRTAIYLLTYSIYRFDIEFIRGDEIRGVWGLLSSSQIISIFIFICGLVILKTSLKDNCENYLFTKERENNAN